MEAFTILMIYLAVINTAAFIAFGLDKSKARRNAWRISEGSLFTLAIFGGSIGSLLGMHIFRHKTLKPKFYIGIPVILGIQAVLLAVFIFLRPIEFSFM